MVRGMIGIGLASALAFGSIAVAAKSDTVLLAVRYPAHGPALDLSTTPDVAFRCKPLRGSMTCTAHVPRSAALSLRARTRPPLGSSSVSAASLPIDGAAWRGACAATPGDVCHLRVDRPRTVLIDTRNS